MLVPALDKLTENMRAYSKLDTRRTMRLAIKYCFMKRVNLFKLRKIFGFIVAATEKAYDMRPSSPDLDVIGGVLSPENLDLIVRAFRYIFDNSAAKETKLYLKTNAGSRDVAFEQVMAGNVPAYWITPPQPVKGKIFFYIHGGGWFVGSPEDSRAFCTEIALATRLRVLSVDYRLYPEHPHPAQIDDVTTAYEWLVNSGINPENIVIGGESAGGHLSLLLLNRLKTDGKLPLPAGAVLISPPIDLSLSNPGFYANIPSDPVLGTNGGGVLILNLLRIAKTDQAGPDFSPVNFDYTSFPPILLQASTCECLYHDAMTLHEKAESAGVDITFQPWDGMLHAFPVGTRQQYKETKEANSRITEFISKILSL